MIKTKKVELPSWLQETRVIAPKRGGHSFLQQNSQRLSLLLRRFAQEADIKHQPLKGWLAPQVKLLTTLSTVLLISLNQNPFIAWLILVCNLSLLLALPPAYLKKIIRQTVISSLFAGLLVLPSFLLLPDQNALFFFGRTCLILLNLSYYRTTTTFTALITALKQLHCPNGLIFTVAITITYLKLLAEYLLGLLEAVTLRSVGKTAHPYQTIGQLFGILYLKTHNYALALYAAMEARGFTGDYQKEAGSTHHWRDNLVLLLGATLFGLLFFLGS
ncbi:hypothetical protein BSQ39_01885 [Loigolactobacillus backii]|uniref:energy-coupling factor transporter transmembrane component T n=1 Tax=Loigolactobacillus backii TaxID=375175 RepID=UPI000C1CAAC8|nr:energy-coupling factor transporter transmembrane component T [Loigolactobacillus backii]PIO82399.1 hypothetical protein BSQ39_01885 [Loigolactobacillus backii]